MKIKRIPWMLIAVAALCLFAPQFPSHAQATAGYAKIASVTTGTSYTDTTCPKGGSCLYEVTSVDASGESAADGPITVLNGGANGNVVLTWQAGACPTGKNCGTPTGYNVYQVAPAVPPTGLAGASN